MELTRLRKERDDLIEILSDEFHEDYDAVSSELLEDCCKGKERSLEEFRAEYTTKMEDITDAIWVSIAHERFFEIIGEIAALEQKTYKEAFQ